MEDRQLSHKVEPRKGAKSAKKAMRIVSQGQAGQE
jgi:hypothetical protein